MAVAGNVVIDPVVKRFLLGVDKDLIKDVFGVSDKDISDRVHSHCMHSNKGAYEDLQDGKRKPDLRKLMINKHLFFNIRNTYS